jgi:rod shape-determining protein MreB
MVVDVGGGTSEVAVISVGGVVAIEAVRVGGFDMDAAIRAYVRDKYGMAIGERTGEEVKLAIGSASATGDRYRAEVRGRDLTIGTAEVVVLDPDEVREALDEPVRAILEIIVRALGRTPPELAQDLILRGMYLVGGGSLLRGMDERISKETALPVHLVDAPLECVVLGAGRCLENEMFPDRPRA